MVWHGLTWSDMVWHGLTWSDMVWHGLTWSDMVRHGPTWSDKGPTRVRQIFLVYGFWILDHASCLVVEWCLILHQWRCWFFKFGITHKWHSLALEHFKHSCLQDVELSVRRSRFKRRAQAVHPQDISPCHPSPTCKCKLMLYAKRWKTHHWKNTGM